MPIFDTEFVVKVETIPEHTVDFELLKSLHATVEFGVFETVCKKTVDMLIECGDIDPKRTQGMKYFEKATGIRIAHRMQVNNFKANHELQRNLINLAKR